MTDSTFYSDRTGHTVPRVDEELSASVWRGLAALIQRRIKDGSLARAFPQYGCTDGDSYITGTDEVAFLDSLGVLVPSLTRTALLDPDHQPATLAILDVIDFVALNIDKPARRAHHSFMQHDHLFFDDQREADPYRFNTPALTPGQAEFQRDIELIFARNGIAFTLGDDLRIRRLGPPESRSVISDFKPATGDEALDAKLTEAVTRFLSTSPSDRQDALEKLWDGFERLKTLELGGKDKKASATQLLDRAAHGSEAFRMVLEQEFKALTEIGNRFTIRHHEHDKHPVPADAAVDYLFVRMLSLVSQILRATGRLAA
ncbi:hypothetical protein [Kitasatospora sp. NPDC050463]|uniref:hypothetical protein n=1 Tax=Kitasatospora sp. NPDC050463 TaxID=3155786 RepID=UPI0033F4F2D1